MKLMRHFLLIATFCIFSITTTSAGEKADFSDVIYQYPHDGKALSKIKRKAAYFEAKGKRAIVLAHQMGEVKESWYFLSTLLQKQGMASLSLNGVGTFDILGAVEFLNKKGYTEILLMGASMGGGGIMRAMDVAPDLDISKIVLLAPGAGPALQSTKIEKLVIVAKQDFYSSRAYDAFEGAKAPKRLQEYSGYEHAQRLFDGEHGDDLITTLLNFFELEE